MFTISAPLPRLDGRVAVVTGANGGLGFATSRVLVSRGAHVVVAARNERKAQEAAKALRDESPGASVEVVMLDLASLDSIQAAARSIRNNHVAVDLLINNAGVMAIPEMRTRDGFEMQLGVNHLGHYALTAELIPNLLAAPAARVVSVTSMARHGARPLDPRNPHLRGCYEPWRAYSQSKKANFHFSLGLQQRFDEAGVKAISVMAHPGFTHTNLASTMVEAHGNDPETSWTERLAATIGMTPIEGAMPQVRAALDADAQGGWLYAPTWIMRGAAVHKPAEPWNQDEVDTLFDLSARATGIDMEVRQAVRWPQSAI